MTEKEIRCLVRSYAPGELPADLQALVDKAKEMTRTSYAPYSHFHVGAAILLETGEIIGGSNQENAAFPATMCAERSAAFWAGANRPGVAFRKIAIAAATDAGFQKDPISPCGTCRQALLEYEKRSGPIEVILYGAGRTFVVPSVSDLMPLSFTEF